MANSFQEDLKYSDSATAKGFWGDAYEEAFPTMSAWAINDENNQSQRLGIDHLIHLGSGRTLRIDAKSRREVWDDILLEFCAKKGKGVAGWINKDLQIDYLAYAFEPIRQVHLFDWITLQRAWRKYGDRLKENCEIVEAYNEPSYGEPYTTQSVAVPIDWLKQAVQESLTVDF